MGVVLVDGAGEPVAPLVVWPCHEEVEQLFLRCSTQWLRRTILLPNGMGGMTVQSALDGLNYQGVESTARLAGISITPELFDDLQTIERGAMGVTIETPPELELYPILNIEFHDDE